MRKKKLSAQINAKTELRVYHEIDRKVEAKEKLRKGKVFNVTMLICANKNYSVILKLVIIFGGLFISAHFCT